MVLPHSLPVAREQLDRHPEVRRPILAWRSVRLPPWRVERSTLNPCPATRPTATASGIVVLVRLSVQESLRDPLGEVHGPRRLPPLARRRRRLLAPLRALMELGIYDQPKAERSDRHERHQGDQARPIGGGGDGRATGGKSRFVGPVRGDLGGGVDQLGIPGAARNDDLSGSKLGIPFACRLRQNSP